MPVNTLRDIIRHGAEQYGDRTAFRFKVKKEVRDRSYRDVDRDSMAVSRMVDSMGLKGEHIALIGVTTYEWIVSYFGIVGSGSVAVPIDAQLPAGEVCDLLNRADVKMLIFDEIRNDVITAVREKCPGAKLLISMQAEEGEEGIGSLSMEMEAHKGEYEAGPDKDQLSTILFTSGTTGKSKGVMLSHRNLVDNAMSLDIKIPPGTVSMTLLPINHVYCLTMDIIKGLSLGLVICINDSIMHVQKNMKLFKPEIVLLVPLVIESIYGKLRDAGSLIPKKMVAKAAFGGNLRIICSGGAYLDPDYIDRFKEYGITILQGYGMTECSPVISTNLEGENKKGSVGKLLPNCEAKVVDEEIWVRGSSVMQGYYKMPCQTAEALVDGWLKTGDLGYVDEDSFVYITGRRKNLIILSNGENVSPEELENQLGRSPFVKEVLVRQKDRVIEAEIFPDYDYGKKKHVKDMEEKLQGVIDSFNKDMPVYKRIYSLIVREEEFEKTPSKKIKRF